jgi:hypothetical protein
MTPEELIELGKKVRGGEPDGQTLVQAWRDQRRRIDQLMLEQRRAGLPQAIQLMAAFMMGAHDAQIHLANQARKAEVVRASLPPDWKLS